ncbi:MAG: hypothetical protein OXJ37_14225 [Bryobacterales bacterium]|nr:hypothetical protein [Bryobacterales bacterium]
MRHLNLNRFHRGSQVARWQVTVADNKMPPQVVFNGLAGGHSHRNHRFRDLRQQGLHITAQDLRDYSPDPRNCRSLRRAVNRDGDVPDALAAQNIGRLAANCFLLRPSNGQIDIDVDVGREQAA